MKQSKTSPKFAELIIYLSHLNMPFMNLKKLAKLLYFIDFTHFEKTRKSITGIDYQKQRYGPMPYPPLFYGTIKQLNKAHKLKLDKPKKDFDITVPIAQVKPNIEAFSGDELETIEIIKNKYFLSSARELENIAKAEPPYKMVESKEMIPYHLAYYRNSFEEMDLEGNGDESMGS